MLSEILSDFINTETAEKFKPILTLLEQNSFNLGKTFSQLKPDMILPFLKDFLSFKAKTSQQSQEAYKLTPIMNFADEKIVNLLNNYYGLT